MKTIRKISKLLYFFVLLAAGFSIYNWESASLLFRGLATSEKGVLISLYQRFFTDTDTWNLMFILLFLGGSILVFVTIDSTLSWAIYRIVKMKYKLKFMLSPAFNLTVQKGISLCAVLALFAVASNLYIIKHGATHTATSPEEISKPQAVVILGTSKYIQNGPARGKENKYYTYRIEAAVELFNAGKASQFIISGDKSKSQIDPVTNLLYDETQDMKNDLVAAGVPPEIIKLDTAGFRTLDSILRIRSLFRLNEMVVISQKFHVERALILAMFYAVKATGYNAAGTSTAGMIQREFLAKPKVVLDFFFFNLQPRIPILDKDGKPIQNYREEYTASSDLHILYPLVLGVFLIYMFITLAKVLDIDYLKKLQDERIVQVISTHQTI